MSFECLKVDREKTRIVINDYISGLCKTDKDEKDAIDLDKAGGKLKVCV